MSIYRGDIFFVNGSGGKINGSEQKQDRPAVVVSNDKANEHSPVVEVVFLTSAEKARYLPTHVDVMCQIPSVALCEQVNSISKGRLCEYIRTCTEEEMKAIDKALMISLGIGQTPDPTSSVNNAMIDDLKMKLEGVERELDEKNNMLIEAQKQITDAQEHNERLMAQNNFLSDCDEVVRLKAQIEVLERQNEKLLDRLIG